jgi:putative ABC transport system permease protein
VLTPMRLWRRLRALFSTPSLDDELDEEMRFHLEMETAKRIVAGMDERRARESARRDFGGVARHREDARDARGVRPVEDFLKDLRVGARTLGKQRTYAIVAVLTLGIGIGATTALWTAVYRVLLAPYPFAEAARLVTVWESNTRTGVKLGGVAPGNFLDWKARARSLDLLAAAEPYSFDWIGPDGPEVFQTALVTADFFPIQGLRPVLGRAFVSEEFEPGRDNVVVLSEALWRNRFGSDSTLVGRAVVFDSVPKVVVGIMSEDALAPFDVEIWAPKIMRPDEPRTRTGGYWQVIGRLASGVSIEQARAEMIGISNQLASEYPATNRSTSATIITLRESIAGSARKSLLVLLGAVAFVMLIACLNVASLQIAEGVRRKRELAIRTAIGAGRGRLIRQLLTESMLVSFIGALVGLFIAHAGVSAIRAFAPEDLWQLEDLRLDGSALLFALALSVICAIAVSLMPVLAAGRIHLAQSLAAGGRTGASSLSRRRANRFLVVSEVALALVLLVGAGLLLRSLATLTRTERGFTTDGVLVTTLQAWSYYPTQPQRVEFVRQALSRLRAVPGVDEVGMTSSLPLAWPIGFERGPVRIEGQPVAPGDELPVVHAVAIAGRYFETLRIPLERGRGITATDMAGTPLVAVINNAFARRYFGDADPIGKRLTIGFMSAPLPREIVGIVGDVRHRGLDADPAPSMFVPHAQAPTGAVHLVARSSGDPALLLRAVRAEMTAMNGAMPLSEMTTMNALLGQRLRERRFQLGLFSAFSAIALLLSAIGIYGVMSRATNERTHEIGVRLAVGAQKTDVRWMVLRNGGSLAVVGVTAGIGMALLLTRYMTGMLFGVTPLDPLTYITAAAVLLVAALLATWMPAWRASAVDPVIALRSD